MRTLIFLRLSAAATLTLALLLAGPPTCHAQPTAGYWDQFDLADGAFPDEWQWTGYSDSAGSFLVYDGAFTHVSGGAAYYYRPGWYRAWNLCGYYELLVKDSNWVFAWRITMTDPASGRCLWLSHDDLYGQWAYTFAECSWENLDPAQYPYGQYMWNNATFLRSVRSPTTGPLVGWHLVRIFETGPEALDVEISVDWEEIFDESYQLIPEGFQGVGSLRSGEMSQASESIWAQWPDAADAGTWGRIKAMFR